MHVELVETFRCTAPHRDSWLVASAERSEVRCILDGVLGCPVCGAEYVIREGVAHFPSSPPAVAASSASSSGLTDAAPFSARQQPERDESDSSELPLRIAALLGAGDRAMTVALVGAPLDLAIAVQSVAPVRCLVMNAPNERDAIRALSEADRPLAIVRSDGPLPVADGSLQGVYVADGNPASHVRALRANGRLVAPSHTPVPAGVTELARDTTHWVAERQAETSAEPASLVELRRRR